MTAAVAGAGAAGCRTARAYDALADFYDRFWGPRFHDAARVVLERLLYARVPGGARLLDVCCGSGHLTSELVARGFRVAGVDRSAGMLRHARRRAPGARLVCGGAECLPVAGQRFDAAVSTFDSINHLLTVDAVERTFRGIASALAPGGLLVFDINTEPAYTSEWGKSSSIVEDDAALFVRGAFDGASRIGRTAITMFRRRAGWERLDVNVEQRCYETDEIAGALSRAGFDRLDAVPAADAGMRGEIAVGRVFFSARRNP